MQYTEENLTVEWAPFNIAQQVTEVALLKAADRVEKEFLQKQKGFVRRELLRQDDTHWVDLVYWENAESATMAASAANESEACNGYFSLMQGVEDATQGISHFQVIKQWW